MPNLYQKVQELEDRMDQVEELSAEAHDLAKDATSQTAADALDFASDVAAEEALDGIADGTVTVEDFQAEDPDGESGYTASQVREIIEAASG